MQLHPEHRETASRRQHRRHDDGASASNVLALAVSRVAALPRLAIALAAPVVGRKVNDVGRAARVGAAADVKREAVGCMGFNVEAHGG